MSFTDLEPLVERYNAAVDDEEKQNAIEAYDAVFKEVVASVESRTRSVEALEEEARALEAELAALELEEQEATPNAAVNASDASSNVKCADYYSFLTKRSTIVGDFTVLEAALRGVAEGDAARISAPWAASDALAGDSVWAAARAALADRVQEVSNVGSAVASTVASADVSLDAVNALLKSIDALQPAAVAAASAYTSKNEGHKATRAEMEGERVGLLTWCRQQKTNLDAMVEPDHAQEFCSSMLANFASMDKNFQVLLDFTNQLPGDESLQRDMLECNEVWLNLQVSAYERMRHALLEVHPKSKLEDEVREFVSFSDEVVDFVQKVRELFSNTNDPDSDRFVRPVVDDAEALLAEYGMHEGLPKQLQDFCNRMDCLRDSYSNLRRAVLSRLTFLTSSVPALTASMRRKEEYVARMKDLKSWVEVKSQGETWGDIHERILSIKALIEREQASLSEAKRL